MAVEYVSLTKASKVMKDECSPKVRSNFYDTFGIDGCLLQCRRMKEWQILRSARGLHNFTKNGNMTRPLAGPFTILQFEESAVNGCGSCSIWSRVLKLLFGTSRVEAERSGLTFRTYTISTSFVLEEQVVEQGNPLKERRIQLFCPEASSVHLNCMPIAGFLMGKEKSVERVSRWLQECEANHSTCASISNTALPARLLDVQAMDDKGTLGLRLFETVNGQQYRYICLSHRWGPTTMKTRNTTKTLGYLKEFIDFHQLPANFRRAISLTRELGVQFLWIDSMCIIQEGDGGQDWNIESSKMADIYRGASLTILMAWDDDDDIFTTPDPNALDKCLRLTDQRESTLFIGTRDYDQKIGGSFAHIGEFKSNNSVFTRGWIYQERLLSTKLVTCHREEFTFQCLENDTCECGSPNTTPHPQTEDQKKIIRNKTTHRQHLAGQISRSNFNQKRFQNRWHEIVVAYMSLNLTMHEDILSAIAGCARALGVFEGQEYIAGLWKATFSRNLMWYNVEPPKQTKPRPNIWTAPTWSWASMQSGQNIGYFNGDSGHDINMIEFFPNRAIEELRYEKSGKDSFGRLKSAHLRADVQLFPCEMRHFCVSQGKDRTSMRQDELNVPRSYVQLPCGADSATMSTYGANVHTSFDIQFTTELKYVPMKPCSKGCGLARVYLLRVLQKKKKKAVSNFFMILNKVGDKNSTFQRIGVVELNWTDPSQSATWFEEVWTPSISSIERITIT